MFHRAVDRIEQKLDDNEQSQKQLQREQDGSEVKSVELERLIDIGMNLIGRRDGMDSFREAAADRYRIATALLDATGRITGLTIATSPHR